MPCSSHAPGSPGPWWLQTFLSLVNECSPAYQSPSKSQETRSENNGPHPAVVCRAQGHISPFWQNLYPSDILSFLKPQKPPLLGTGLETENNNSTLSLRSPASPSSFYRHSFSKHPQRMSGAKAAAPPLYRWDLKPRCSGTTQGPKASHLIQAGGELTSQDLSKPPISMLRDRAKT